MYSNSFYITLPSNASMDLYPDNTLAKYITKLHHRINLEGDNWEVALAEIQYPNNFQLLTTSFMWLQITYQNLQSDSKFRDSFLMLPDIYFKDAESILIELNKIGNGIQFNYFRDIDKFQITYSGEEIGQLVLSQKLAVLLGFIHNRGTELTDPTKSWTVEFEKGVIHTFNPANLTLTVTEISEIQSKYPPKFLRNIASHMYIYSDIVEPNLVGDCVSPLLRIVKSENSSKRENVVAIFNNLYYVPVLKRQFDTIEINIRDDEGNLVPFVSGKLNVRLHFKRVENGNANRTL